MNLNRLVLLQLSFAGLLVLALGISSLAGETVCWLEAESFRSSGGWSRDTQHVDLMGSTYLLATGLGRPVEDAVTRVQIPRPGDYRLHVRCRDWLPRYSPGRFQVVVAGKRSVEMGRGKDDAWRWATGGTFRLEAGECEVRIHDLTGWWGRVDALVLATSGYAPPGDAAQLAAARIRHLGVSAEVKELDPFDVVVVGAGPAGMGASVAAARQGERVAVIQDRPVVGGNSSSEISVPPMGHIGRPPDRVNVTGLCEEFFPRQGWSSFADSEKMEAILRAEKNLSLFLNTRACGVQMKEGAATPLESGEKGRDGAIEAVLAIDVRTGQRLSFGAPIFVDCTGHGWIGYYAGAEFRMGQEARSEYGESLAPERAGKRTQGNSLYQAVIVERDRPVPFECPPWACRWRASEDFEPAGSHRRLGDLDIRRPENFDRPSRGKGRNPGNDLDGGAVRRWWVEYGGMLDTVRDAERIRDELLRINLGLWNYAKNHNPKTRERNRRRELVWLNYVPGVRESRRLMGPYILTQREYDDRVVHPDTVAFTDWGPDVHHPEGFWVRGNDCIHVYKGRRTSIPYRTLYSRNIQNLMMAGRCHSASHIGLGGTRVMRPCLAMGQAAGTAAAIAVAKETTPAGVYEKHLDVLQQRLLKDGCYLMGVKNRDPRDLALQARITASSHTAGMPAAKVMSGCSRVVGDDRHAWRPSGDGPHWIAFDLPGGARVNVAHVTFESAASAVRIETTAGGQWMTVGRIERSGRRRYVVPLVPAATGTIRFTFSRPVAVCEIRLYDESDDTLEAIRRRFAMSAPGLEKPRLPGVFLDDDENHRLCRWSLIRESTRLSTSGWRNPPRAGFRCRPRSVAGDPPGRRELAS
jgi:hypothetical protein